MASLSAELADITGDPGQKSFADWRDDDPGHVFVVAFLDGEPVGCGALRPLGDGTAELKRMYAARSKSGIGTAILAFLETTARAAGHRRLMLETRLVNTTAIRFYERHGYTRILNYGRYVGRADAACFSKIL